jgi:hypothetical protein
MRNRFRVEIYDEDKNNDLTIYSDEGVNREHLAELVFGNLKRFSGNIRAYVYDTKNQRKTFAMLLPMETVTKYKPKQLTKDELGII